MEKLLEYIYYGTAKIRGWDLKKFCSASNRLGIKPKFTASKVQKYLNKLKTNDQTIDMVYKGRGEMIANGFEQMFCDQSWFDITVVAEGVEFEAHRVALSVGSEYFRGTLGEEKYRTVEQKGMAYK